MSSFQEPYYVKCLTAGTAGCIADILTFPLDVAKVRLQIQGEGSPSSQYRGIIGTILTIKRHEGFRGLYSGLVPGLQRQMAFSSIRIGLYDPVKIYYAKTLGGSEEAEHNPLIRIAAGVTTGAIAVLIAQPTDVVKIRMQADNGGAAGLKRYSSSFNAYSNIARHEGRAGLWKGVAPNVVRTAIINAAELVCYDYIKEFFLMKKIFKDNIFCHFASGFGAGFCATVIASPVDVVKTRIMNSEKGTYRNMFHCATRMVREEGLRSFYKGFMPSFIRLGSWNICLFVSYEQLKRLVNPFYSCNPPSLDYHHSILLLASGVHASPFKANSFNSKHMNQWDV